MSILEAIRGWTASCSQNHDGNFQEKGRAKLNKITLRLILQGSIIVQIIKEKEIAKISRQQDLLRWVDSV